jgi:molybdenum cofactor cytidylyltransferase
MSGRPSSIAGIILAAGLSTRFGGNKLLAELDGVAIIHRVVETALASGLEQIVIVLGHDQAPIRAALGDLAKNDRLEIIVNQDYRHGQSTSVTAGLKAVQANFTAAMYLMGDQPLLDSGIIDSLIKAYQSTDHDICYPSFQNQRRNPVIFGDVFFNDILALGGDTGARAIIDANPDRAMAVVFNQEEPFLDVDEENDLNSLHSTSAK